MYIFWQAKSLFLRQADIESREKEKKID